MASSPNRGYLSQWMLDMLKAEHMTASLVLADKEGGWNDDPGQPGNTFTEYVVLTPLPSSRVEGSIGDPQTDWLLPYSLTSYGAVCAQVEGQADKVRRIVSEVKRVSVDLGGESWRVVTITADTIGEVVPNRQVSPIELSQRDVVTVRISKETR